MPFSVLVRYLLVLFVHSLYASSYFSLVFVWLFNAIKIYKDVFVKVHGCEDQKESVSSSCTPGAKIAVTKAFFGHGHSHKASCDSSWISQNCGTKGVKDKVKLLCQEKERVSLHQQRMCLETHPAYSDLMQICLLNMFAIQVIPIKYANALLSRK